MAWKDFFSMSECRDHLFHVHEQHLTIPELEAFFADNDLNFIGFEFFPEETHQHYCQLFGSRGWSFSDLDRWADFERDNPQTFASMFLFWL